MLKRINPISRNSLLFIDGRGIVNYKNLVKCLVSHTLDSNKIYKFGNLPPCMGNENVATHLSGRVCSGIREGNFFVSLPEYFKQISDILGGPPYPGTLNLSCSLDEKNDFFSKQRHGTIFGFRKDGRMFGNVQYCHITIRSLPCILVIPAMNKHHDTIMEIVSKVSLREAFSLKDGDVVEVLPCIPKKKNRGIKATETIP